MVRPPTSRITPGSPFPARAEPWNDLIDSHATVESMSEQSVTLPLELTNLATAVLVQNSDVSHAQGEYVIVESVLTDPTEQGEGMFRLSPTLTSVESDWTGGTHWGLIAVWAQDVSEYEVGYAYTSGMALTKLQRTHDFHDHADINPDDSYDDAGTLTVPLRSHPSGSWQILWTNAATATVAPVPGWAVVRFKGIWQRELKCQIPTDSELAPGSSMTVPVSLDGADALDPLNKADIEVHHNWFDQLGNPLGSESKILAKWFPDELKWVVVAAEC